MWLPENHDGLEYCVVEVVKEKGDTKDVERGLFKGLVKEGGINFLWIKTTSTVVRGCSLEFYNILSIEVYDGVIKALTFFKAEKDEQEKAENLIREIFDCFKDIRLEKDNRLIDIDRYSNIPEDFNKAPGEKKITPARTAHSSVVQAFHKQGNNNIKVDTRNNYGVNNYYANREPEACFFKRKGRKPAKKTLEELDNKLDLIMEGEYSPEFPEIKNDNDKGNDKKDKIESEYDCSYGAFDGCY